MQQPDPIPEEVRRFVLTSIASVPYLEALLLLRADERRRWGAAALARRLYIGDKVAQALLAELLAGGVIIPCGDQPGATLYCYHPASPELRQRIDSVADLYATQLVAMTHLIHSKLDRKAQQFADAFKWRKD